MTRPFRFGVVAPLRSDLPTWLARARRIADSGYSTLLMPDFPLLQPAPAPTLAIAAALTDLRVGTWVYASPLRPAWLTAWEAHSLSQLTDGRFELGIGTGRPGIDDELRDRGMSAVPPDERLARIRRRLGLRRLLVVLVHGRRLREDGCGQEQDGWYECGDVHRARPLRRRYEYARGGVLTTR